MRGSEGDERLRIVVCVDETSSFGFTDMDGDVDLGGGLQMVLFRCHCSDGLGWDGGRWECM